MCDCNAIEIKNLKGQVSNLDIAFHNAVAELSVARSDLEDTNTALDAYRELRAKMSTNIRMLTEERDLSRELFQGMVSEYADLLDRHSKMCDDYDGLVSRYDALLSRNDAEHDPV